jgi:hypothetical protein
VFRRCGLFYMLDRLARAPQFSLTLEAWRKNRVPFFLPDTDALHSYFSSLDTSEKAVLISRADAVLAGELRMFSGWVAPGSPGGDWHVNPVTGQKWPLEPWTKVMRNEATCGDIKLAWEQNRFAHFYDVIFAYALTKHAKYVVFVSEQWASWEKSNPYPKGINWVNGQELSIRMSAWVCTVYVMGDDPSFKPDDFDRFLRLLWLHTRHIDRHISYAYFAVHNNHLIGEALGLFMSGTLFPCFKASKKWASRGRRFLESKKSVGQFYEDGGYCQLSFNYQRLAMSYYLWAIRMGECVGEPFSNEIYRLVKKSAALFSDCMNEVDGNLPNWGTNDGADFLPWTHCDYSDFRPVIQAASVLQNGVPVLHPGPWDRLVVLLFGQDTRQKDHDFSDGKTGVSNYPKTGVHVLRNGPGDYLFFRCGSVFDRFGQADQLHVDVFWKGLNLAVDGGSYSYNGEQQYHRHFMGTRSHNTVAVDGRDQMFLARRFKWLDWVQANLLESTENRMVGEQLGYMAGPQVVHRRAVSTDGLGYCVRDDLTAETDASHMLELHWLIQCESVSYEKTEQCISFKLGTQKGVVMMSISASHMTRLSIESGKEDPYFPDGFVSRYYGKRDPAYSIRLTMDAASSAWFETRFEDDI